MKKWLIMSFSVVLVCYGSLAQSAPKAKEPKAPKKPQPTAFEKMDTNSDGSISLEEFCAGKDGKPLEGKGKENKEKMFTKWDTDGNKQLSAEEFKLKGAKPKAPKSN